jgi:hypothetical protein
MECHKQLIADCRWMAELSSTGAADFLYQLKPEICAKGDRLLLSGTTSELMCMRACLERSPSSRSWRACPPALFTSP